MSEQINKVLADRPQAFTTAEQAQARANIGAAGAADYVAYSDLGVTPASAVTSINGSSVGFTGVITDSNLTGDGSTSALGISTSVKLAKDVYSANYRYSNLQFGDDSGVSSMLSRESLYFRKDGTQGAWLNKNGISAQGQSEGFSLTTTSNALHPLGLRQLENNGNNTSLVSPSEVTMAGRGLRGTPLQTYSAQLATLQPSSLSITYEGGDSAKQSAYLTFSSLRFSANDTSNTSYLPTSMYARSGLEMRFFDADLGHTNILNQSYSGITINGSSNLAINEICASSILMRNAWSPATHSALHACSASRWIDTAGNWSYVEPRYIRFATGGENSSEYIDNAKVKAYDAVNKLMSSLSAWATAQGWTPN